MSLNVFTDPKQVPKNIEVVTYNDIFFDMNTELVDDDTVQSILLDIDNAHYAGPNAFYARNSNIALNTENLSTGCKTALNVYLNRNKCFILNECGDNAKESILRLEDGNVLDPYPVFVYSLQRYFDDDSCDILIDGIHFLDLDDFLDYVNNNYHLVNVLS